MPRATRVAREIERRRGDQARETAGFITADRGCWMQPSARDEGAAFQNERYVYRVAGPSLCWLSHAESSMDEGFLDGTVETPNSSQPNDVEPNLC